jgi:TPR repeat protein
MLSINKGKGSSDDAINFKMTRIEELILQRKAIDAEIEAEYKREHEAAAKGEADAQFNLGIIYYKGKVCPKILLRHLAPLN